jgi:hypothetical protein
LKPLTLNEHQRLVDNSVILEEDGHGLKVLETSDGHIIKMFRQKRVISSALSKPYASRFVKNAHILKKLGIHTVVVDMFYCPQLKEPWSNIDRSPARLFARYCIAAFSPTLSWKVLFGFLLNCTTKEFSSGQYI